MSTKPSSSGSTPHSAAMRSERAQRALQALARVVVLAAELLAHVHHLHVAALVVLAVGVVVRVRARVPALPHVLHEDMASALATGAMTPVTQKSTRSAMRDGLPKASAKSQRRW